MLAIRGRRRVGKSTLVEEFLLGAGIPHVFFACSRGGAPEEELAAFLSELEQSDLPAAGELSEGLRPDSWAAAFRLVAGTAPDDEPIAVVLDEFPWLTERDPAIEGVLQTAWDRRLSRKPILLILVGSDLHMMEALERYDRPLHGRFRPVVVHPLNPAEVGDLTGCEPRTALDAYCIIGGFPELAQTWRAKDTPRAYLKRALGDPTSPLIVTGERALRSEVPAGLSPRAVLSAVGAGETGFNKIHRRSGVGRTTVGEALRALEEKGMVLKLSPFATRGDAKTNRYIVSDPHLRFWLRFIEPGLELVERRRGDLLLERILSQWSAYRGRAIEPIARRALERLLPDPARFGDASFVSSYWTRTNRPEVDLVGADDDRKPKRAAFIGSIKWRERDAFTAADAGNLAALRDAVPLTDERTLLIGLSLTGFSDDARLDAKLGPDDLVAAWHSRG